ncbi:hypothetical protein N0V84_003838 [Fusarium piperis]|uniref:Uncharacterized protein n=1 Tax=Fusarium piperis TaxID=1435070 RepID=A0A9W9BQS8_9HYPO|nr:hypothetical protein N0V84_003838 [Fusarium piperis]
MCPSNDKNTICGQRYSHLMQAGTRFTFGPQCRTSVQDHIIRNRLTPLKWRKNFDELLEAMYLTQHGAHIVDLMRAKVETGLRARIRNMVSGGLIKEEVRNGDTRYAWRADADNFLGLQGWWKDWSPAASQKLAKPDKKPSSVPASKSPKGKNTILKQSLSGNRVRGGNIGSNAIAGVGGDVNLRQTIYIYCRDDISLDNDSSDDHDDDGSDVLIYKESVSEDDDLFDSSEDDELVEVPEVKTEAHNIAMDDATPTQQTKPGFLTHPLQPFQYQQFINNCNHSCGHHHQPPPNPVVPDLPFPPPPPPQFPPRTAPPAEAETPSASGSSSGVLYTPSSSASDLHTIPPPTPITVPCDPTPPPPIIISSGPALPGNVTGRPCSISPQESASEINPSPQGRLSLRTSIDRRVIRAGLQDCTEDQLLQTIDQLGNALTGNMIWRLKVLSGPDDPAWLAQDLEEKKDRHLDLLEVVCEELNERLGLGCGEGVLALSWWWFEG